MGESPPPFSPIFLTNENPNLIRDAPLQNKPVYHRTLGYRFNRD